MMTQAELAGYRQSLLALQHRLGADVSSLADEVLSADEQASGNLSHVPIHPADLGTDAYERELTQGLLENEEQTLEEIGAALERIEKGSFGCCERCHREIPEPRLQALPYTRYCVKCASDLPAKP
jgi:RNA polymerase-binding transcription factor DksA